MLDHAHGRRNVRHVGDPMEVPVELSASWRPVRAAGLPQVFTGGWVGYCGYDTVRYVYSGACVVMVD